MISPKPALHLLLFDDPTPDPHTCPQDPELFGQNVTSPTIAPAVGMTSPQAEEAIPFDELAKVLENGTSVLDPT